MSKYIWDRDLKRFIPAAEWHRRHPPPKNMGPMVISDEHAPFKSMADGRIYDSKSAYRRTLKEHGFIEVGNDEPAPRYPDFEPESAVPDLEKAWDAA